MPIGVVAAASGAAFFAVLAFTPLVERWARSRGLVDRPGGRHLHGRAVPRLGGVSLFAGLAAGAGALVALGLSPRPVTAVLAGSALAWAVGLVDDLRPLRPAAKLAGQAAAASISIALGLRIEFVSVPWGWWGNPSGLVPLGPWSVPATAFWLVAVSNAVNLLDGLDGLAAGVVAIAAAAGALAAAGQGLVEAAGLLAVLWAGCLAFLRYNFSPARIFMGDSGALMLGFAFAGAAAAGTAKGPAAMALLVPVLSLGVPLFDTAWAVLRRIREGRPVTEGDRGHLHHRLVAAGRSTWQAVLVLYGASAALAAVALALPPQGRLSAAVGMALVSAWALIWAQARGAGAGALFRLRRGAGGPGEPARHGHLRHPARGYQAGPGHPGPRAVRRL